MNANFKNTKINVPDLAFRQFLHLEKQLIAFMEFVPYIKTNENIISPKLSTIVLDTCSLIESIICHFINEKNKRHSFQSLAEKCEPHFDLENATTILITSPIILISPFADWTHSIPTWWNAYNKIKHDRLSNYNFSTFKNALFSLTALHQLIARSNLFINQMIIAKWYNENDESFLEMPIARVSGCGLNSMPVESELFVTATKDNFITKKNNYDEIDNWEFTTRVKTLILNYEFNI